MNRLQYILTAKTQYDIQSPFLFEFYSEVLNPKIGHDERARLCIRRGDRYAEVRYKIVDWYGASEADASGWDVDELFATEQKGMIGLVRKPHRDRESEARWNGLVGRNDVTLAVDLFDMGVVFSYDKLSKQSVLFRCF